MTKLSNSPLKEKLNDFFTENEDIASNFMHEDSELPDTVDFYKIKFECVDSYGGEEQGSTYYSVYKFTEDQEIVYIKFNGWYASHYGSEYQDFSFVTPKQKTVEVYE